MRAPCKFAGGAPSIVLGNIRGNICVLHASWEQCSSGLHCYWKSTQLIIIVLMYVIMYNIIKKYIMYNMNYIL